MSLSILDYDSQVTQLEWQVIVYLNKALKNNFGEGWSGEDVKTISDGIKESMPTVKGAVGSLVKKHILWIDDEYESIGFRSQADMNYVEIK